MRSRSVTGFWCSWVCAAESPRRWDTSVCALPGNPDRFIVKGRAYKMDALARMKGTDMVVCDLEGFKIEAPEGSPVLRPEDPLDHLPDVSERTVAVHVHPRFTTLMGSLKQQRHPLGNTPLAGRRLSGWHADLRRARLH